VSAAKNKPPLGLEIDFGEALTRFAKIDPKELQGNLKPKRLKKNPRQEKTKPT